MDAVKLLESKLEDMLYQLDRDGYDTDWLEIELTKEEIIVLLKKLKA